MAIALLGGGVSRAGDPPPVDDATVERYVVVLETAPRGEPRAARDARMAVAGLAPATVAALDDATARLFADPNLAALDVARRFGANLTGQLPSVRPASPAAPGDALYRRVAGVHLFASFTMASVGWSDQALAASRAINDRVRIRGYPTRELETAARLRLFVEFPEAGRGLVDRDRAVRLVAALDAGKRLAELEGTADADALVPADVAASLDALSEAMAGVADAPVFGGGAPEEAGGEADGGGEEDGDEGEARDRRAPAVPGARSADHVARAALLARLDRLRDAAARGAVIPGLDPTGDAAPWAVAFETGPASAVEARLRRRLPALAMRTLGDPGFEGEMAGIVPHALAWLERRGDSAAEDDRALRDACFDLLGQGGDAAIGALVRLLSSPSESLRSEAADTLVELADRAGDLARIDRADAEALARTSPETLAMLRSAAARQRAGFARAAPAIVAASRAHPELAERLARVLGGAGVGGDAAFARLRELAVRGSPEQRHAALGAVPSGADPDEALAFLGERLRDEPDATVRRAAASAIWSLGATGFVAIRDGFPAYGPGARIAVLDALRVAVPATADVLAASAALPDDLLDEEDGDDGDDAEDLDVADRARLAGAAVDTPAGRAVARLDAGALRAFVRTAWTTSPGPRVRALALVGLVRLRALSAADLDAVRAELRTPSSSLLDGAARALVAIGVRDDRVVESLVAALTGPEPASDDLDPSLRAVPGLDAQFARLSGRPAATLVLALEALRGDAFAALEPRLEAIAAAGTWASAGVSMQLVRRRMREHLRFDPGAIPLPDFGRQPPKGR